MALYEDLRQKFQSGDIVAAGKGLPKLWLLAPHWPRTALLEAYIRRQERAYVSEIDALLKLLSLLDEYGLRVEKIDYGNRVLAAEGFSMLGSAYAMLGKAHQAVGAYLRSAQLELTDERRLVEISNAIFAAHYVSDFRAMDFQRLFGIYQEILSRRPCQPPKIFSHAKLRVGFLSANFRRQPLTHFLRPLLKFWPHEKFALYAYKSGERQDDFTTELRNYFTQWYDVNDLTDAQIAAKMRDDELDVLWELDGHSAGNRLGVLAYQPAALQIFGLGYMGSTGLTETDYFITDAICLKNPGSKFYLTEQPLLVGDCHLCYDPIDKMPTTAPLPPCRTNKFITFGCFNNFSKVTDELLTVWAKILHTVPRSRLLLKHRIFDSNEATAYTKQRMQNCGLDVRRIEMRGLTDDYLSEYNEVDIALDTYPYTGVLTTCEALYMGVPVVSCYGVRPGSCFGLSLLSAAGLRELAAPSLAAYQSIAVNLACDAELLTRLRRTLRTRVQNSILTDGQAYALKVAAVVEAAYRQKCEKGIDDEQ